MALFIDNREHDDPAERPTLLGVFAHPDDEEIGTAGALLACAERGVNVVLVAATSGEAGEISDPALATPETLGAVREQELRAACELLGFAEPIFLRYPDGGVSIADPDRLRDDVVSLVRRNRRWRRR
jgi:N-acetyl-1-D-myo-inositol-2-amino-2-deoxy-alpha-D-glucopyranoside deacetylase